MFSAVEAREVHHAGLVEELDRILRPHWPVLREQTGPLTGEGEDEDGNGDGGGDSDSADESDAEDDADADRSTADDDDEDDEDEEENAAQANRTAERLSQMEKKVAAGEKDKRKLERLLRAERQKSNADQGRYKEMYEEEKKRGDDLEGKLKNGNLNRTVDQLARKLNFKNPGIVAPLVDLKDAVDEDGDVDEGLVQRKLEELAKKEKYLVSEKRTQGEVRGDASERKKAQRNGNGSASSDDDVKPGMERLRKGYAAAESGS